MSWLNTFGTLLALGYAAQQINDAMEDAQQQDEAVDEGVRQQLEPSTDTKIPVLYGDAYFGGNLVDAAISTDLKNMQFVLSLAEITGTKLSDSNPTSYTFKNVYLNNNRVVFKADGYTVDYTLDVSGNQDVSMRDLVKIYFYCNDPQQPDGYAGTTPAAHTLIPHWDAVDYPMTDLMYAVIDITYNQSKGVTQLPECIFHVESNMSLAGDVLYDYMTSSRYGANIFSGDIDSSILTDLNTYCTAGFTYTDALAQAQSGPISFNGLIDTATECLRNMQEIAKAGGSWLSYDIHDGKWRVVINDIIRVANPSIVNGSSYTIFELGNTDYTAIGAASNTVGLTFTANTGIINATAIQSGYKYKIQTVGTTDYTLIGAADNNVGTEFVATGAGTGTGTVDAKVGTGVVYDDVIVTTASDSNIIGDIGITGTTLTQLSNIVDVKYQNTDILDKTDFVKMEIPPGELKNAEPETTLQLSLPFTNKQSVAMKLGLAALRQARIDKIINFRTDYSYANLKAGDVIGITSSFLGYTNKPFRVMSYSEVEGDDGAIELEFVALEWDDSVYAYDITELAIETDDGISGIGTIGKPDVPVVTNNQVSNIPHVLIAADVPSGIVDTMEYWITYDTAVGADEDREYVKIGQESKTNGQPFTENETVTFQYSNLTSGDFFVKVRGTNTRNAGPFSDPTGLIEYVPEVQADQITPETDWAGLLTNYAIFTLLSNLDQIYDVVTGEKGLMDALKEIFFPNSTQSTFASMKDELLNDTDFLDGVTTYTQGATVVAPTTLDELTDTNVTGSQDWDQLFWDSATSKWTTRTACCPKPTVDYLVQRPLEISFTCPANNSVGAPVTGDCCIAYDKDTSLIYADLLEGAGNCYLYKSDGTLVDTVAASACTFDGNMIKIPFATRAHGTDYYITMQEGVGTYNDYFTPCIGTPETWGFTTSMAIESPCVCAGEVLPLPADIQAHIDANPYTKPTDPSYTSQTFSDCTGFDGKINFTVSYNVNIIAGPETATATIYDDFDDSVVATYTPCKVKIEGSGATFPTLNIAHNKTYYLEYDDGFFKSSSVSEEPANIAGTRSGDRGLVRAISIQYDADSDCPGIPFPNEYEITTPAVDYVYPTSYTGNIDTTSDSNLDLSLPGPIQAGSDPTKKLRVFDDTDTEIYAQPATHGTVSISNAGNDGLQIATSSPTDGATDVEALENIVIQFNKNIVIGTGSFHLYKDSGPTLVQSFDVTTNYGDDETDRIFEIEGTTVTLNPTVAMEWNTAYHIKADAGCLVSSCGYVWAGITDATTLNFTTEEGIDLVAVPATVSDSGELQVTIPDGYEPGTGQMKIYDGANNLQATIDPTDSNVWIEDDEDF